MGLRDINPFGSEDVDFKRYQGNLEGVLGVPTQGILSTSEREGVKDMGYRGRRSYDRGPREMHKIICSECGKEDEVPFKPTEGRPVYCRECFAKRRQPRW